VLDTSFLLDLPSSLMRPTPSWIVVSPEQTLKRRLEKELRLHPLLVHLLVSRGIKDPEEAHRHLYPKLAHFADPFLLPDMELAVERLLRAIKGREKIAIYGDYDVDGTTGASVLYLFLKSLGQEPLVFFPHRERHGYGFHPAFVRQIKEQGADLVITVDCGITSYEACRLARELGLEVIVTDHHEVPSELPPALAVVNPKRRDSLYPHRDLAGVGVAFALVRALRSRLYHQGFFRENVPNLKRFLDLVALGTIADIVPLTGENRLIAYFGLEELTHTQRPGLKALKEAAGLKGPVGVTEVVYRLAPRINAAGRLQEARLAFELLVTEDEARAKSLAAQLNGLNAERQKLEEKVLREALRQIQAYPPEKWAYVLAGEDWPLGVIGIVASKLQELFYRPVILLSAQEEMWRGSGRSIPEVNLYECLAACQAHLQGFGGHPAAAGLKLALQDLEAFAQAFEEQVAQALGRVPPSPRLYLDAWVRVRDILHPDFIEGYLKLGPFGPGYPEPLFALKDFEVRRLALVKEKHLKFYLWQEGMGLEAIWFGYGQELPPRITALAASLDLSEFQGRQYLQLRIRDLKT